MVGKATDGKGDPSKDPDHTIDAENMTVDTLDSVEINTVSEANDTNGHPSQETDVTIDAKNSNVDEPANGDPSKDPDHIIDAKKTTFDEPDCPLDSVEVNTLGEANDTNGHPHQESDVTVDTKNSNIVKPDIIHDNSKTIDTNAEQTESMVYDDVEHNDVFQKELLVQCAHDSEEVNTVDKATGKNLSIQGGVEMINATQLEGSSVIFGEQNIVHNGVTSTQDLLTLVDFNNDEDQVSNSEEVKWNDDGGGSSTDAKQIKIKREVQNCCS